MHDIHTHLYWNSYDTDRDEVIRRARAAGVQKLFVIGCTVEESKQCVTLTEQYEDMYAAVGVHPQEFFDESGIWNLESWIGELRELAKNKKIIAIGECGLEYYVHPTSNTVSVTEEQKQWQKEGFLAQIALAEELKLPLIVHCRANPGQSDAYEDMFDILQSKISNPQAVILHCYMGNTEVTKKFLTLPKVFFSFTGNITYPVKKTIAGTKDDLTETVKLVPPDRIFTETDCPFLAPQSSRGERNEPTAVIEVAKQIASLQGADLSAIEQATEANFKRVFTLKKG